MERRAFRGLHGDEGSANRVREAVSHFNVLDELYPNSVTVRL